MNKLYTKIYSLVIKLSWITNRCWLLVLSHIWYTQYTDRHLLPSTDIWQIPKFWILQHTCRNQHIKTKFGRKKLKNRTSHSHRRPRTSPSLLLFHLYFVPGSSYEWVFIAMNFLFSTLVPKFRMCFLLLPPFVVFVSPGFRVSMCIDCHNAACRVVPHLKFLK